MSATAPAGQPGVPALGDRRVACEGRDDTCLLIARVFAVHGAGVAACVLSSRGGATAGVEAVASSAREWRAPARRYPPSPEAGVVTPSRRREADALLDPVPFAVSDAPSEAQGAGLVARPAKRMLLRSHQRIAGGLGAWRRDQTSRVLPCR